MKRRSDKETALLIALMFKKSGLKRARISDNTLRYISNRSTIRTVFRESVREWLDDLGLIYIEIPRGYALLPIDALSGAPPVTAKKYLLDDLKALESGDLNFEDIEDELNPQA